MRIADIVHLPVEATAAYRRKSTPINDYQLLATAGRGQALHEHQDRLVLKMRGADIPFETLFALQIDDLELDADANLSVRHAAQVTFLCKLDHADYVDLQALVRARETMDGPLFSQAFLPPDAQPAEDLSQICQSPGGKGTSRRIVPFGQQSRTLAKAPRSRQGDRA